MANPLKPHAVLVAQAHGDDPFLKREAVAELMDRAKIPLDSPVYDGLRDQLAVPAVNAILTERDPTTDLKVWSSTHQVQGQVQRTTALSEPSLVAITKWYSAMIAGFTRGHNQYVQLYADREGITFEEAQTRLVALAAAI